MNEIIYKYDLRVQSGRYIVRLPCGAKPISVGFQRSSLGIGTSNALPVLRVWVVVDPEVIANSRDLHPFTFLVVATGSPDHIGGLNFLGRADVDGLVYHVFCTRGEHLGVHP